LTLTSKKEGQRTLFFNGEEHVGTVLAKTSWFTWYTHDKSGHTKTFADAKKAILSELE